VVVFHRQIRVLVPGEVTLILGFFWGDRLLDERAVWIWQPSVEPDWDDEVPMQEGDPGSDPERN
jgi:hypothetical protein